jgi:hypothetical protein
MILFLEKIDVYNFQIVLWCIDLFIDVSFPSLLYFKPWIVAVVVLHHPAVGMRFVAFVSNWGDESFMEVRDVRLFMEWKHVSVVFKRVI